MKEFVEKLIEKIKVTSLEIIVTGTKDKPYFEIKYKEVGKEDYNIGYSSYDLNTVFNWKDEYFEIVNQLAEEYINCSTNISTNISTDKTKINDNDLMIVESLSSLYPMKEFEEEALQRVIGCAKKEYNNGWISCEKELPSKSGKYIVTQERYAIDDKFHTGRKRTEVDYAEFNANDNMWLRANFFKVIAWMPLPTPYQKGE